MAGQVTERELAPAPTRAISFATAQLSDDAEIRRLLRENPMAGSISLSFEREPSFFTDQAHPQETKQTILARHQGQLVCVGSCSIRQRFIHGQPTRVGYLGGLRLASTHSRQTSILRSGFEFFHQRQLDHPAEHYFTTIASDNLRARRILERGLPGMPTYTPAIELVTVLIPARHHSRPSPHTAHQDPHAFFEQLSSRLQESQRSYQLAPVWSAAELHSLSTLGLAHHHFTQNGEASAALWNTSCFKQTVIRGYAPTLARLRPILNVYATLARGIHLPAVGQPLRIAFVSHLIPGTPPNDFIGLLHILQSQAAQNHINVLTLAFDSHDPRLALVTSHFRTRTYRTQLYWVHWPDCGHIPPPSASRLFAPEAALL